MAVTVHRWRPEVEPLIYYGDAASYHHWEFRTLLEQAQEAASRTAASDPTDGSALTNGEGDAEEEFPTTAAPPSKPEPSQSRCDPDRDVMRDRYTLVSKIMEGLQGDAFLIARDMGIAALVADQGLRNLVKKVKETAFGKADGKGKNLTLEQRRAKLAEIKSKSKCLRCRGTGHWAGDPIGRFPNDKWKTTTPASQSKTVMVAYMSESSDSADDGACTVLTPGRGEAPTACRKSESNSQGQAHQCTCRCTHRWSQFILRTTCIPRTSFLPVSEHPLPKPKSKSVAKKNPPNPPLAQKCAVCTDFVRQGSTAYTIKKTCRDDCGHSIVERRDDDIWEYPFQDCPHELEEVPRVFSGPFANSVDVSSMRFPQKPEDNVLLLHSVLRRPPSLP